MDGMFSMMLNMPTDSIQRRLRNPITSNYDSKQIICGKDILLSRNYKYYWKCIPLLIHLETIKHAIARNEI